MYSFVTMAKKGEVVVNVKVWSGEWCYFEVTQEKKEKGSQWYNCIVLKRSLPYPLHWIEKICGIDFLRRFVKRKAEKLCGKYQNKLIL